MTLSVPVQYDRKGGSKMRIVNRVAFAVCLVLGFVIAGSAGYAEQKYAQQKVIYDIDGTGGDAGAAYRAALSNIHNHTTVAGKDSITIKVVLHSRGVNLLSEPKNNQKVPSDVTRLKTQNVRSLVCCNDLTTQEINYETDLFEIFEDRIVPAGVAELSHLQQRYIYVKH